MIHSKTDHFLSGSMLYLYQLFRKLEMARFDGPAGGTQPNKIPRDELEQAAHEFEDESGDDSESEPDHISSFPLNARGVDAKLVSSSKITKDHPRKSIIEF